MTDDTRNQSIATVFDRAAPTYDDIDPAFFAYSGQRLVEEAQLLCHYTQYFFVFFSIILASLRIGLSGSLVWMYSPDEQKEIKT